MLAIRKVSAQVIPRFDPTRIRGAAFQSPNGTAGVVDIEFPASAKPTIRMAVVQYLEKAGVRGVTPEQLSVIRHGATFDVLSGGDALAHGDVLSAVNADSVRPGQSSARLDELFRQGDRLSLAGESGGG